MDVIICGPFSTEINLKIAGIQLVDRVGVDTAGHSKELLVVNNMELRSEIVGAKITDEANRGGMVAREAQKLAKASARAPFRNFVAVLELGIKDVSRAAKNLGAAQVFAIQVSATKELHRGHATITPWHVVIKPHSIVHGKWPQTDVVFIWPVNGQMNHHGMGHVLDGFDCTLG